VPPAKFIHDEEDRRGMAVSSLVAGGCIMSGTEIRQSLLFTMVTPIPTRASIRRWCCPM
jgi:glucose-1-phosphate adenylyltransferase